MNGDRTEYSGYFNAPEEKGWKHMVTFSTITGGKNLSGYYSFVEDFKRDKVSATRVRTAQYGNAWLKPVKGEWEAILKLARGYRPEPSKKELKRPSRP